MAKQISLKFSFRSSGRSQQSFGEHYADPIVSIGFGKNSADYIELPFLSHFSKNCEDVQH